MKLTALLLIPILLCMGCKESKPDYEEIDSPHTIPLLATDFCKIIEIEGQVLDGNDTGKKADSGQTMISINTVEGRKLVAPIDMPLSVFSFSSFELPKSGAKVRLRGYETGGYTGIPQEAFKDIPRVATTSHHFKHYFQVTKIL